MSRYNSDDDVLIILQRIARRVANLEKANPLNYGTIDTGGLIIKNAGQLLIEGGGKLDVADGGAISVYDALNQLNTFIGEGRVDFADNGFVTGTIGEFDGEYFNIATDNWVDSIMRGMSLHRSGVGNPFFTVAQALSGGALECAFGYDGIPFTHWGVKSKAVFMTGGVDQLSKIQMQDDGDIFIGADDIFRTLWLEGYEVDITATGRVDIDAVGEIQIDCGGNISIDPDGELQFFITTTTNPANLNQSSNNVRIVSSARKYKEDIQDVEIDPADVLKMRPRTWLDKGDLARYERYQQVKAIAKSNGEEEFFDEEEVPYPKRTIGFVAEEIDELPSLRPLVQYNDDGEPESLYYDRMAAVFVGVAKRNYQRVDALEKEVAEHKKLIADLTARIVALEKKPKG